MLKNQKILGLILARGNSKRLPGKNLKLFFGKPLIAWTIKAAQESRYIDATLVSTDSPEIRAFASEAGAMTPFLRPSELASDTTTSDEVVLHALQWLKEHQLQQYDIVVMLQPTSPLRTYQDIDAALEQFIANQAAKSLISFSHFSKNPTWLKVENSHKFIESYFPESIVPAKPSSQPLLPNGAIYIVRTQTFLQEPHLYTSATSCFLMPKNKSVDIDDQDDFHLAELYAPEVLGTQKEGDHVAV